MSNLIFRFQERFCVARDEITATTFTYDAFVLYSSVDDDRQWVHYKLLTELEKVYGFDFAYTTEIFLLELISLII